MEAVEIVEVMMVIALRVKLEVALAESILVLEYGSKTSNNEIS